MTNARRVGALGAMSVALVLCAPQLDRAAATAKLAITPSGSNDPDPFNVTW